MAGVAQPTIAAAESGSRALSAKASDSLSQTLHVLPRHILESKRQDVLQFFISVGASNVRVFGSIARGEDTETSDVDLMADFPEGFGLHARECLIRKLEKLLTLPVSVVSATGTGERFERAKQEALTL